MVLCACGCGDELSPSRARTSKYIKGHYSKMCKKNPSKLFLLREEKSKIFKNKAFKHKYDKLVAINREIAKLVKHRGVPAWDDLRIDYSKGKEYCSGYNNDDIECVMCFENGSCANKSCFKGG